MTQLFSVKTVYLMESVMKNWMIQRIRNSSIKMMIFRLQKEKTDFPRKGLEYTGNYRKIYRTVIREAKRNRTINIH
jgi:hypothetical protein